MAGFQWGILGSGNHLYSIAGPIKVGTFLSSSLTWATIPAGGVNGQVQFNFNGGLAGSSKLTWDGSNLYVNGSAVVTFATLPPYPEAAGDVGEIQFSDGLGGFVSNCALKFDELDGLTVNGARCLTTDDLGSIVAPRVFAAIFDGGSTTPTAGTTVQCPPSPVACTIRQSTIIGDQTSGSAVVNVKKSTYAGFPTTTSIAASAKPTLASAQKNQDSTLLGWTLNVAVGDIIEFVLDSVTTHRRIQVSIQASVP